MPPFLRGYGRDAFGRAAGQRGFDGPVLQGVGIIDAAINRVGRAIQGAKELPELVKGPDGRLYYPDGRPAGVLDGDVRRDQRGNEGPVDTRDLRRNYEGGGRRREPERQAPPPYNSRQTVWQNPDGSYRQDADPAPQRPQSAPNAGVSASTNEGLPRNQVAIDKLNKDQHELNSGFATMVDGDKLIRIAEGKMDKDTINPGGREMFEQSGLSHDRNGLNTFINFGREALENPEMETMRDTLKAHPDLSRQILAQWQQDVRAAGQDPASPGHYNSDRTTTIVDRMAEAARDPAKLAQMKAATTMAGLQSAMTGAPAAVTGPSTNKDVWQYSEGPKAKAYENSLTPQQKTLLGQISDSRGNDEQQATKSYAPGTTLGLYIPDSEKTRQLRESYETSLSPAQRQMRLEATQEAQAQKSRFDEQHPVMGVIKRDGAASPAAAQPAARELLNAETLKDLNAQAQREAGGIPADGTKMTTAMANNLSSMGAVPISVGQGAEAKTVYMQGGKVIGAYERGSADGNDGGHFVSREKLETQLAASGGSIEKVERGAQLAMDTGLKATLEAMAGPKPGAAATATVLNKPVVDPGFRNA